MESLLCISQRVPSPRSFFCIFVLSPLHLGSRSPALGHACRFTVGSCRIPGDAMES